MDLLRKYEPILNEISKFDFVNGIIIFGSYLKNPSSLSDLDIAIILSSNSKKHEKDLILSYGNEELDISILEELPIPLQYKIMDEGKIYYQKYDLSKLKRFTRHQFIEFLPYLKKAYQNRGYKFTI